MSRYAAGNGKRKNRINYKGIFFLAGVFCLTAFVVAGLVKISANGGMAKAKKEAKLNESAYTTVQSSKEMPKTESSTTAPVTTQSETQAPSTTKAVTEGTKPSTEGNSPMSDNIKNFYEKAAFVGDSVMLGFSNYASKMGEGFLGDPLFLVAGSFSAANALEPVKSDSTHPLYKGERRLIEDSIAESKTERAFLFFGLNDIGLYGVEDTFEHYKTLIERIKKKSPKVKIYIISTTYMLSARETKLLTNANIAALNSKMSEFCRANKYGFIDIANKLGDSKNGLQVKYCSDGYLHENELAYQIWTSVLCDYAVKSR